ncbi:unnamed protein product [Rotaria magnacalcarata]
MAEAFKTSTSCNDYTFKLNKATTTTKYWICTIKDCAAKVHTDSNNGLMKTVDNRSHLPRKEKLERLAKQFHSTSIALFLPAKAKK